jgi:hypothetical protein
MTGDDALGAILAVGEVGSPSVQPAGFRLVSEAPRRLAAVERPRNTR